MGHEGGRHRLFEHGELVFEDGRVLFAGHGFAGEVARSVDYGEALIAPGFIDCDALSDLDTTVLAFDNQPAWRTGRVWPRDYQDAGPREMLTPDELAFQKRFAFANLIRNGITTALPIASLFYREWGETADEFEAAAEAAVSLGLRTYLGPAYRSGNQVVESDGSIAPFFDGPRGLAGLAEAIAFCTRMEGRGEGLVRTMLAPDRIETCTPELLVGTRDAARDLDVPVRLHCCQSRIELELVRKLRGSSPPAWLAGLGFLSERVLLPHGIFVSGSRHVAQPGDDLAIIRDSGASVVHCPLVSARFGQAMDTFAGYRRMGIPIAMGTDTAPPDMVLNMQAGLLLNRVLAADAQAVRCEDYFDAATVGGADALRRPDLGRLCAGARADIVVFDLGRPHLVPVIDPVQTLLLCGQGRDARHVIVDGRFVMQDGTIPGVDEAADVKRAQTQFDRLAALYPERTWGHPPVHEIFSSAYPVVRRPA
jgi:cytosine/adenosine deaminase-related metal-dependent hydrolase